MDEELMKLIDLLAEIPAKREAAEVKRLRERCARLEKALRGVEWVDDPERGLSYCPDCHMPRGKGHQSDCDIKAALADGKEGSQ